LEITQTITFQKLKDNLRKLRPLKESLPERKIKRKIYFKLSRLLRLKERTLIKSYFKGWKTLNRGERIGDLGLISPILIFSQTKQEDFR